MPKHIRLPNLFLLLTVLVMCVGAAQVLGAEEQAPIQSLSDLKDRIIDRSNQSDFVNSLRMSLLSGIAFYPDEVIAAIFEVAQNPQALQDGKAPEDPELKQAYEFLSASPDILDRMAKHPVAVKVLGEMATLNLAHTWNLIDDLRAQYREKSGVPVAQAVTAEEVPPPVRIDAAGNAESDVDDMTIILKSGNKAYVKNKENPGVVYVYSATDTKDGRVASVEKVIELGNQENQPTGTDTTRQPGETSSAPSVDPSSLSNPANWEPADESAATGFRSSSDYAQNLPPDSASSPGSNFRPSQASSPAPRRTYNKPSQESWDYYSADTSGSDEGKRSRYRRTKDEAESQEVFSGQGVEPSLLEVALERGLFYNSYVFDSFDSGGFQGPDHSDRRGGSGFQGPNHTRESPYGGFRGEGDGIDDRTNLR